MRDIFLLTKVLYKNSFGKNRNEKSKIGTALLLIFAFAYLIGAVGFLSYELINALMTINQEQLFITASLLTVCAFTLFRTLFTAISVLYFSKDVEFLLPMPLNPLKIVFAKFNLMLISNFLTEVIILGIPYIIYWYLLDLSVSFLIYSLLIFLVFPIIPMLISSVIIVAIMKFTSFLRNKDVVQYISIAISIGLILWMQTINSSVNGTTDFVLANKIVEINGYSSVFAKYFFTVEQSVNILTSNSFMEIVKNLGLLYAESIGIFVLVVFAISKIYIKTALKVSSSATRARKVKLKELSRNSIFKTYIAKEFKLLFRTPIFLFQCVLPSFIFPIIFAIPMYEEISETTTSGMSFLEYTNIFSGVFESGFGFGLLIIVINFLYMFNFMSVTAVSREGENALFMKYIPISLSRQYKYKAIPGMIINLVPVTFLFVVLKIACPSINNYIYLEAIGIAILCNILVNYFSVMIDVLRPKLHWSSEYAVVKQNMNMLYSFILSVIVMGIILGISSYIDNVHILSLILTGIIVLSLIVFELVLNKFQIKIFNRIA